MPRRRDSRRFYEGIELLARWTLICGLEVGWIWFSLAILPGRLRWLVIPLMVTKLWFLVRWQRGQGSKGRDEGTKQ